MANAFSNRMDIVFPAMWSVASAATLGDGSATDADGRLLDRLQYRRDFVALYGAAGRGGFAMAFSTLTARW